MSLIPFDDLPDHARLWLFSADRALRPDEQRLLVDSVETGLAEWAAHGSPVRWGHRISHDQFLMIGVDETRTALTGCSIDNAVGQIRALEDRLEVSFLDNSRIFFRDGETIRMVSRAEFRELATEGRVHGDTVVMNNVIATVGELRQGLWEVPARRSWHGEAFPVRV
jgi:hypothetical protein